jgi:hypothetical protein
MSESTLTNPSWKDRSNWLSPSWRRALKTPLVIALGVALVMQLLIALMAGRSAGLAPAVLDQALLELDPEAVSAIEIQDGDGETLNLVRSGDQWLLPDLGDFPASETRVEQLIERLAGLIRPLPVATSAAAQARFKVADDAFERRLRLRGEGGDLATLMVGDSPGFRRLFARLAGDDAVYDLRLALFDLSVSPDDWLERGRLQLERSDIVRVAGADWILAKRDDGWRLEGDDQLPDAAAVDALLSSVASLGYRGVLGTDEKPEYGLATPLLMLEVDRADGSRRTYRIGRIADSEDYALKPDDDRYYYRLAAFDLEGLLEQSAATLLGQQVSQDDALDAALPETQAPESAAGSESEPETNAVPGSVAESGSESGSETGSAAPE